MMEFDNMFDTARSWFSSAPDDRREEITKLSLMMQLQAVGSNPASVLLAACGLVMSAILTIEVIEAIDGGMSPSEAMDHVRRERRPDSSDDGVESVLHVIKLEGDDPRGKFTLDDLMRAMRRSGGGDDGVQN